MSPIGKQVRETNDEYDMWTELRADDSGHGGNRRHEPVDPTKDRVARIRVTRATIQSVAYRIRRVANVKEHSIGARYSGASAAGNPLSSGLVVGGDSVFVTDGGFTGSGPFVTPA